MKGRKEELQIFNDDELRELLPPDPLPPAGKGRKSQARKDAEKEYAQTKKEREIELRKLIGITADDIRNELEMRRLEREEEEDLETAQPNFSEEEMNQEEQQFTPPKRIKQNPQMRAQLPDENWEGTYDPQQIQAMQQQYAGKNMGYEYAKPPPRGKNKKLNVGYQNIPPMPDIRTPTQPRFAGDLYDSLINVILNHKKEIKQTNAVTLPKAQKYAKSMGKGYRAAEVDLNPEDGLKEREVVIYNKAGQPVVINGYKLTRSKAPFRKLWQENTRNGYVDDEYFSMNDWLQEQYKPTDRKNPWETVQLGREVVPAFEQLYAQGYARPMKPKKQLSTYQVFGKLVSPLLKQMYAENGVNVCNKLCPPLQMLQFLYTTAVEYPFAVKSGGNFANYSSFKKYLSTDQGKAALRNYFEQTFFDVDSQNNPVKFRMTSGDVQNLLTVTHPQIANGQLSIMDFILQGLNTAELEQKYVESYDEQTGKVTYKKLKPTEKFALEDIKNDVSNLLSFVIHIVKGMPDENEISQLSFNQSLLKKGGQSTILDAEDLNFSGIF